MARDGDRDRDTPPPPSPRKGGRPPAVKAGGMRVSKKQENGASERNPKNPVKEKISSVASIAKMQNMGVLLAGALERISHKFPAAVLQVAHQKPRPALEKITLPKRIYLIQQPRKC